jgi:hypothetical protein
MGGCGQLVAYVKFCWDGRKDLCWCCFGEACVVEDDQVNERVYFGVMGIVVNVFSVAWDVLWKL